MGITKYHGRLSVTCTSIHGVFNLLYLLSIYLCLSCRSHQMYYMFGFLFLVFIILVITCSEATILLCYFHLCAEVNSMISAIWGIVHIKYLRLKKEESIEYTVCDCHCQRSHL